MTPGALCLWLIFRHSTPRRGRIVACSTGCPTPGAHSSWGECVRSKRVQLSDITAHQTNQAIYTASDLYRSAREDGLQPERVSVAAVMKARRVTETTGVPFRADKPNNGQPLGEE